MTCDHAIELLPWLLNGTIVAAERDEIRRHLETCEGCREALADTREAWALYNLHLPSAAVVALAYGEEPAGLDSQIVQLHLSSCPECAAELELARTSRRLEEADNLSLFPAPAAPRKSRESATWRTAAMAAGLTALVAASGWIYEARQMGSRTDLAAAQTESPPVPTPTAGSPKPSTAGQVAELEAKVRDLEQSQNRLQEMADDAVQQVAELRTPQINPWVGDIGPTEVERGPGGEAGGEEQTVDAAGRPATPLLTANDTPGSREIRVLDAQGNEVFSDSGLLRTKYDTYLVSFPPGFLKPGRYTIQLYTHEGGKLAPQETYKIRVQ